jgi:hypothetical protein
MIYFSKRISGEGWISFESDPYLSKTKRRIYEKCLPCLENFLQQLEEGKTEIDLGPAYECWKLTLIFNNLEQCLDFLNAFSDLYPDEEVMGKFGTGSPEKPTKVVVFHIDDRKALKGLVKKAREALKRVGLVSSLKITRGCSNPYEYLFGPSKRWRKTLTPLYPERIPEVIRRIRKMIYFSS